jgi:hypothetical protein
LQQLGIDIDGVQVVAIVTQRVCSVEQCLKIRIKIGHLASPFLFVNLPQKITMRLSRSVIDIPFLAACKRTPEPGEKAGGLSRRGS